MFCSFIFILLCIWDKDEVSFSTEQNQTERNDHHNVITLKVNSVFFIVVERSYSMAADQRFSWFIALEDIVNGFS